VCGHYEGVYQRVADHLADEELSIGDYVLTNGSIAAPVVVDAVSRLVPGVLGESESAVSESFANGMLEYPQDTRPAEFRGWKVPDVLLSGNHAAINAWRQEEAERRTRERQGKSKSERLVQPGPAPDVDNAEDHGEVREGTVTP
jgi:tRNA (guanine37-N1)-methyltransferase